MKAKSTIGKIYVSTNAYLGVLKHFVEDSVKAVIYMFHRFDKLTKSSTIDFLNTNALRNCNKLKFRN